MPEFASTAVDMMVQGIHGNVMKNFQVAYPFQKSSVGDIVRLREEPLAPTKWLLAQVVEIYPGKNGKVCMTTIETVKGR